MQDMCYLSIEMETAFDILLISPEQNIPDEAEMVNELFSRGLSVFHLRKPDWSFEQLHDFLKKIHQEFHNKIVLHAHFVLADTFRLKGIHLNESNKKLIGQFEQYNIISASFHSIQDIKENTFPYQYVLLSPVFNSISKPGYNGKFDLRLLTEELNVIRKGNQSAPKIIALGGISAANIITVKEAGFSGAALLGAVWTCENPIETYLQIKTLAGLK